MSPGEWTNATASGDVALSCGSCAAIFDVPPDTHRIDDTGFVVPAVRCPDDSCGSYVYVRLLNYSDAVLT